MTTIISITASPITTLGDDKYDYTGEDRILHNIITNDYEVFYSGQNQGMMDYKLIDAVNSLSTFRVYYRRKSNSPFIFLGSTNSSSIVQERICARRINSLPNERLQIRLVIPLVNVENTQIPTQFEGSGCYKKSVLQHCNYHGGGSLYDGFYTM